MEIVELDQIFCYFPKSCFSLNFTGSSKTYYNLLLLFNYLFKFINLIIPNSPINMYYVLNLTYSAKYVLAYHEEII